ncbi:hypothetical protein ACE6H2_004553 [Prunus campanulata]
MIICENPFKLDFAVCNKGWEFNQKLHISTQEKQDYQSLNQILQEDPTLHLRKKKVLKEEDRILLLLRLILWAPSIAVVYPNFTSFSVSFYFLIGASPSRTLPTRKINQLVCVNVMFAVPLP